MFLQIDKQTTDCVTYAPFYTIIDQEIFNMMLAKSMHQIARIEFRNSKFPYARGLCPLATPARGLCPLDPRQGASPLEPPSLINNLAPPPFQRLDPPLVLVVERVTRMTDAGRKRYLLHNYL